MARARDLCHGISLDRFTKSYAKKSKSSAIFISAALMFLDRIHIKTAHVLCEDKLVGMKIFTNYCLRCTDTGIDPEIIH